MPTILSNEPFELTNVPSTLSDNMANPTVPGVGAYTMVYDSVGANWDRAAAITLCDADTGAGTVLVPQVNIVQRASGGPQETFIQANPAFVQLKGTATYTEPAAPTDIGPTWNFPWIYNALSSSWYRQVQAQLTYSGAGLPQTGLPIQAAAGYYNRQAGIDTPANNSFHSLRINKQRGLHTSVRGEDGAPLLSGDAFGRLRVSEPYTIFDSKQIFDNQPLAWDDAATSGSGTSSTHSVNTASTTLAVGASTAGTRVRQTKMRFNYQPGKSQLIFLTFNLDKSGGGTGITRRAGYFDTNNGLFLEDSAGTYRFVRRTYVTGSAVDNAVAQSSWNIDKLDGSGDSGVTLDFSKTQILVIDFEWLGVGRVRMGFVIDGQIIYAHQFLNTNVLSEVYMSTPNLPLRFECINSGAGAASSLECICGSVISEGGIERNGVLFAKDTGGAVIALATAATVYAGIGLQLKSTHFAAAVDQVRMSAICPGTNKAVLWRLYLNPTVAGSFTYTGITNSAIQAAVGDGSTNTVSGGTILDAGTLVDSGGSDTYLANALRLGSTIAGVGDTLVLCFVPLVNNTDIVATITWRELT